MEILEILRLCERIHEQELMKIHTMIANEEIRLRESKQIPVSEDDDALGCGS